MPGVTTFACEDRENIAECLNVLRSRIVGNAISAEEVQKSCRPEVGQKLTVCLAQKAIAKP